MDESGNRCGRLAPSSRISFAADQYSNLPSATLAAIGDGVKDPFNAADAIFAAARSLRASGAPGDWHDAIFAYNHADWYVEDVLVGAEKYAGKGSATLEAAGSEACASSAVPDGPAVEKMVAEANRINGLELTYEYAAPGKEARREPVTPGAYRPCRDSA